MGLFGRGALVSGGVDHPTDQISKCSEAGVHVFKSPSNVLLQGAQLFRDTERLELAVGEEGFARNDLEEQTA